MRKLGAVVCLLLLASACGGTSETVGRSNSTTTAWTTAAAPAPTTIAMHPEWTTENVTEFVKDISYKWPWYLQDYYSDRIYNDCGGKRFVTESTFRHYKYEFEPDLRVTYVGVYQNKYAAKVEWYFEDGRNRDTTIYFEVADRQYEPYRTDNKDIQRPYSFRLDSYWPSGMQDFC